MVEHSAGARILIVDDDAANVALLRALLARAGYTDVHAEQDSGAVLHRFHALQPDAVLLDLHLPPPDGFTLLEELQRLIDPEDLVPLLVLTADTSHGARERALRAGAHDFVTKPYHRGELALRVRNALALQHRHRALRRHADAITAALAARDEAERTSAEERRAARARIEAVLTTRGLAMAFQPIVDLTDGAMVGVEALARFLIEPHRDAAAWFAEADDVALAIDLEVEAVRAALERIPELAADTFLSINASAKTIASPQLADLLGQHPALARLVIELTEHEPVRDYAALRAAVAPWRERGLRLAVDDTGSGWSSLQHILRLGPDIIKLDRELIRDVDVDPGRRALVSSMQYFAGEMGAEVVAEGIERPGELAALRAMGVRRGQGYLLGVPSLDPVTVAADVLAAPVTGPGGAAPPAAGPATAPTAPTALARPGRELDMAAVFRQSPARHLLLSPDLRIVEATDAYLAATMTTRAELVGRHLFDAFPDNPDDPGADGSRNLAASLERVRYRRMPDAMAVQRYDVRRPDADGGTFEARYWSPLNVPVLSERGGLVGIVHQVDDVTELVRLRKGDDPPASGLGIAASVEERLYLRGRVLEQANERLRELDRLKSDFLGRMSHELRTPLNAILGFGQLLQLDATQPDQRDAVEHILRAGRHLLDLIDEVLDIAQVESGSINLSMEPVQVREVVADAVALATPLAERDGVRLDVEEAPEARYVLADRQRLLQVLLNLLSNAVKYNRPGGTVRVASGEVDGIVELSVTDEGPGIDPGRRHRLFQPFDRLGQEGSGIEGTGVGLALARGLAQRMGGSLALERSDEQGSTFVVGLPVGEAPDAVAAGVPALVDLRASATGGGDVTVLCIEDNASNLRLVDAVLRRVAGARLLTAMQGRLGYELAVTQQPQLVLLDLHLPDLHGEEVLHLLRSDPATAGLQVVVLSADATPGRIDRLLAAGADDYLTKPLDIERLLALVRRCATVTR